MKEGASNCVERHLNLNDCDTSLLWTYSQVGRKCCFHSQRITPHASRLRYFILLFFFCFCFFVVFFVFFVFVFFPRKILYIYRQHTNDKGNDKEKCYNK